MPRSHGRAYSLSVRTPRRWWPYVVVAVVALVGVLGTLAIARPPDRSSSRLELAIAHYGYPLWFVEAELTFPVPSSGTNPAVTLNPWEYPTETDWGRLLLSWLAVAAMPLALVWWYERRRSSVTRLNRRKSEA
jgi:hypothetical protein